MRHISTRRSIGLAIAVGALLSLGATDHASSHTSANHIEEVDGRPEPDRRGDFAGGIAARLLADGGPSLPGDLFLLMAQAGSEADARLYDQTPFEHDGGPHVDTAESNRIAADLAERLTGEAVAPLELTSAPGGGPSGGLVYAIGYLDLLTDGGFTGGLRVAASGTIGPDGYVGPITAIDQKVAAASLAEVSVLFTAGVPDETTIASYSGRYTGEMHWVRSADTTLAEQRGWDRYERWGDQRPAGMDIVAVRHLGDVAAYLCGAGSADACDVRDALG
jgi:hypothetical protein